MEGLKNKTDRDVSQRGQGILAEAMERLTIQSHCAGGGTIQTGAQAEECRLAAAGGTDNGAGRARSQGERDVVEHGQGAAAMLINFADMLDTQEWHKGRWVHMVNRLRVAFFVCLMLCGTAILTAETQPLQDTTKSSSDAKVILFFGDSLTAGYGLDPAQAFPAVIQEKIKARGWNFRAMNAGLSGETTAGGLRRIDWVLQRPIAVLVLALGANDALRGLPVEAAQHNLQAIIERTKKKYPGVQVVLAGMQAPPNLGQDYSTRFRAMFPDLAAAHGAALVPFLLDGVGGIPALNLPDGLHPTPAGHKIVANNVWKVLEPVLQTMQ